MIIYIYIYISTWSFLAHLNLPSLSIVCLSSSVNYYILIFFSEITETIESKPGGNVHWMDLYNIYGGRGEGCCHQKSITETKGLKMPSMLLFSVFAPTLIIIFFIFLKKKSFCSKPACFLCPFWKGAFIAL